MVLRGGILNSLSDYVRDERVVEVLVQVLSVAFSMGRGSLILHDFVELLQDHLAFEPLLFLCVRPAHLASYHHS